ncbi:MAG: hypothetical protein JWM99_1772 [Verrucomicrobiales bacterium]|nr:hypothetical protein [Verrucomicrobiales bacterium]
MNAEPVKKHHEYRISKISLIVFGVLLVLSGFLLSVGGNYWPRYAVILEEFLVVLAANRRCVEPNRFSSF